MLLCAQELAALAERVAQARRLLVLTGAGMSAESGVPTFREAQTGLWARFSPEDLATPEAFANDPRLVSQVDVSNVRDAVVILKDDVALIHTGDEHFAERVQSYLDLAPRLREEVPLIDSVDLRFGERVFVKPQGTGR